MKILFGIALFLVGIYLYFQYKIRHFTDNMTPEERANTAFVFFDLEEAGMIGSSRFAKVHKKVMKQKLLVNFDCVSDGDHFLIVHSKKAHALCGPALETAFAPAAE